MFRGISSAVLVSCSLMIPAALGEAQASAAGTARACSTSGLRFTATSGSSTESVKVERLKAAGSPCATARSVAKTVARKLLRSSSVPARIDGFKLAVRSPCSGCAPVWQVKATKSGATITFSVMGGA